MAPASKPSDNGSGRRLAAPIDTESLRALGRRDSGALCGWVEAQPQGRVTGTTPSTGIQAPGPRA
jgi:hypothetical protein